MKKLVEVMVNGEVVESMLNAEQIDELKTFGYEYKIVSNDTSIDETVLKEVKQDEKFIYDGREFKVTPKNFIYELKDNKFHRVSKATFLEAQRNDPSNYFADPKLLEENAWLDYKEKQVTFGLSKEDIVEEFGECYYLEPSYDEGSKRVFSGRYLVKEDNHFMIVSETMNFNGELYITYEKDIHPYMYTLAINTMFQTNKQAFKYLPTMSFETKDGKFIKTYQYNFFGLNVGCMVLDNQVIKYKALPNEDDKKSALRQARLLAKQRRQEALDEIQIKQCSQEETVRNADKNQPSQYGGFSHGNKYLDREEA